MDTLIAIPILSLLVVLQSAIVSRLPLLHGTADLFLLVLIGWALQEPVKTHWQWSLLGGLIVGYASILPLTVPILTYMAITGVVLLVKQKIWENQIFAMFAMTFFGSLFSQGISALVVSIRGAPLPLIDTFRLIILPSLLLNLLLAGPVYAIMKDLAEWVYPEKIKA
jgi:hypothetical protein